MYHGTGLGLSCFSILCLASQAVDDSADCDMQSTQAKACFNRLCICQCRSFAGEALERERFGADVVASYHSGVGFAKAKANVESLNRYRFILHLMYWQQLTAMWLKLKSVTIVCIVVAQEDEMLCLPCSVICTEHGKPNTAVLLCKTSEQEHKPATKLLLLTVTEQCKVGEQHM